MIEGVVRLLFHDLLLLRRHERLLGTHPRILAIGMTKHWLDIDLVAWIVIVCAMDRYWLELEVLPGGPKEIHIGCLRRSFHLRGRR